MIRAANPSPRQLFRSPVLFFAFGFGSGLAPRAPGTVGTLAAIAPYLWFSSYGIWIYLALLLAVCVSGVWICGRAAQRLGVHDHSGIVWDEFAGFLVTMSVAPPGWLWIAVGFVLFRLFDIWKPWPISWADRKLKGGTGIMLDDLIAGFFAGLLLYLASVALK